MKRTIGLTLGLLPICLNLGCSEKPKPAPALSGKTFPISEDYSPASPSGPGVPGNTVGMGGMSSTPSASPPPVPPVPSASIVARGPSSVRQMPPAPPRLRFEKADLESNLKYLGDSGGVEVLGVCRLSESKVECWSATGESDSGLGKEVEQALRFRPETKVPLAFGKKNRLLVLRGSRLLPEQGELPLPPPRLIAVGSLSQEPLATWTVGSLEGQIRGRWHDYRYLCAFAEDADAKETFARFTLTEPSLLSDSKTKMASQAEFDLGEFKFKIREVRRIESARNPNGDPAAISWQMSTEISPPGKGLTLQIRALDASGTPIEYVDASGKPASRQDYERDLAERNSETMARAQAPDSGDSPAGPRRLRFRPAEIRRISGLPSEPFFASTIDPHQISRLEFVVWRPRSLQLNRIPLEPKAK